MKFKSYASIIAVSVCLLSGTNASIADPAAVHESIGISFEFAGGPTVSPNWGSGQIVFSGSDVAKFEGFVGEVLNQVAASGTKVYKSTSGVANTGSSYITKMRGFYACPSDNPEGDYTDASDIDTTADSVMKNGPVYAFRLANGGIDEIQGLGAWWANPNADATCLAYHTGVDGDGNPNTDIAIICEAGNGNGNEIPFVHGQLNLLMAGGVEGVHTAKEALVISDYDNILNNASSSYSLYNSFGELKEADATPFNKECPTFE